MRNIVPASIVSAVSNIAPVVVAKAKPAVLRYLPFMVLLVLTLAVTMVPAMAQSQTLVIPDLADPIADTKAAGTQLIETYGGPLLVVMVGFCAFNWVWFKVRAAIH